MVFLRPTLGAKNDFFLLFIEIQFRFAHLSIFRSKCMKLKLRIGYFGKVMVKPISAQDQKTLDTAIALANELSTRSMTTPAPTTPVSPNKRKFSFRFPSVGDHEKTVEKRNFSEEAHSTPDLQVFIWLFCDTLLLFFTFIY